MSIHPIEEAQENLQGLIDEVAESHKPVIITSQNSNAVLVDEQDWASIQETLYLLSVPNIREAIKEGMETPIEACAKELNW
ncbi:MAG: type II toxin-antitoxin system prevent-host-death family antitoxin [Leptolyngbya foveolarum]|jgi:prevent-host-death family protein|uniref:Antitoxin n=1 Tax=Leptolyngbya foveolarum TaxID=47253 RepID=A0A2W4TZ49_9CYAN|nr:MAG: type II toxin-antitoxin system prevent-host-death family antitoxin [Leptolyngbya foveolarum]